MNGTPQGQTDVEPVPPARVAVRARAASDAVVAAYEEYQRPLHSFLLAATRDVATAEDLTQETFLRLVREAREGCYPDKPRAWLYRVATNLATSRGRRLQSAARWLGRQTGGGVAGSPEEEVLRHETSADAWRALGHVGREARIALLLAAHGFSGAEIAALLGKSEGATRVLLYRARLKIRERMTGEEVAR